MKRLWEDQRGRKRNEKERCVTLETGREGERSGWGKVMKYHERRTWDTGKGQIDQMIIGRRKRGEGRRWTDKVREREERRGGLLVFCMPLSLDP